MKLTQNTLLFCLLTLFAACSSNSYRTENVQQPNEEIEYKIKSIYANSKLSKHLSFELFRLAMIGFYNIENLKKRDKLVIIDFSKPSTAERFYLIDLETEKLLYKCLVAHGKNSGGNLPTVFSNVPQSKKSSLGFYLTAETYSGKHGYSLRLDGIEKDFNHNARERAIVVHSANYVSQKYIQKNKRLGRSWGCPALPKELSEEIINEISDGRCIFIYAKDEDYLNNSKYILRE
ncbi:MAG: murein L,D-transpeptidase catalytic domain family protein [Aureispira sp.]|nr:murein L,D-transpeptidase catalytic domain family protein [Aureispira sp.]